MIERGLGKGTQGRPVAGACDRRGSFVTKNIKEEQEREADADVEVSSWTASCTTGEDNVEIAEHIVRFGAYRLLRL